MPEKLERCVMKLMSDPNFKPKNGKDKKSSAYAVCTAMLNKESSNESIIKTESLSDVSLNYTIPISVSEKDESKPLDVFIAGVAVEETVSENGIKYLAEELEKSASTLSNKPLLDSHKRDSIKDVLGTVVDAHYEPNSKSVRFKAKVIDADTKERIKDGRVKNVSIGATVKELTKETVEYDEGNVESYYVAKGLSFKELSLVSVPGVPTASIDSVLSEVFESKRDNVKVTLNKKEEVVEMENNVADKILEDLKRELDEVKESNKSLKDEKQKIADELIEKSKSLDAIELSRKRELVNELVNIKKELKIVSDSEVSQYSEKLMSYSEEILKDMLNESKKTLKLIKEEEGNKPKGSLPEEEEDKDESDESEEGLAKKMLSEGYIVERTRVGLTIGKKTPSRFSGIFLGVGGN